MGTAGNASSGVSRDRVYDVVVVGGGSAGAVLAARLSEPPSRRVLLLEAGRDWRAAEASPELRSPNYHDVLERGGFAWPGLEAMLVEGREPSGYLQGRGLGGSSTVNAQGAMRGLPGDYDGWGIAGWGWRELLPCFVRLERDVDFGERDYHGDAGPTTICRWPEADWGAVSRGLAEAAVALGHEPHDDLNAPDSVGVSAQPWHRNGHGRITSVDAYLEPARGRPNLEIRGESLVDRVELADGRAVGVRVEGRLVEAGEVVVCAGGVHSPALLLRSGIGPADELRRVGVAVAADLPGVGANLHDHPTLTIGVELAPGARFASRRSPVAGSFVRWQEQGLDDVAICPHDLRAGDTSRGGLMVALLQPRSRGALAIVSADPRAQPLLRFCLLAEEQDRRRFRAAVRHAAELLRQRALARAGEADLSFAGLDDDALDAWIGERANAFVHAAGGCALGRVVDERCRVRGVEGLRVVDASIIPALPRAAPYLTVLAVAERAAEVFED